MIRFFRNNIFFKFSIALVLIFPIMFFLNTGFLTDQYWKVIQAGIFSLSFAIILLWPNYKKVLFWVALALIVIMVFLFILDLIDIADMIGSTGVGIIIINLISYLPQLVKLGYIKTL